MNARDIGVLSVAAVLTLAAGMWFARRARALPASVNGDKFAPLGFSWDAKRGAYTRLNAAGQIEVYAADVYL